MTIRANTFALFVCSLLATPLLGAVLFAQEPTEDIVIDEATSTERAAEPAPDWFKRERLRGNVNVGDFVVGPGKSEFQLKPGDTATFEISISNRISDDRTFKLEVEDITGSTDGSQAVGIAPGERGPYSIKDYISFPDDTFELGLGERARVPVTVSIPTNAEPGGFYGSVLVSTVQDSNSSGGAPRSPIIARVGSLVFVTVDGDQLREGETTELSLLTDKWWLESGPVDFGIVYENTGSVHVNPYGELSITNMLGEEVGFRELEPWFVLPKSLRTREVSWDREFLLGRYVATVRVNRGYDDIVDERSVAFWVLPWKIVGGIFLALFIAVFVIRLFLRTFELKRK